MYLHLLWSTKNQKSSIPTHIVSQLYHYICDVTLLNNCQTIGGQVFSDHLQLVVKFSPEIRLADLIINLKVVTLLWMRTNFPEMRDFEWQKSDFSLTVSTKEVGPLVNKITQSGCF